MTLKKVVIIMTKSIQVLLFFIFLGYALAAQTNRIVTLQQEALGATGIARIEKLIALSDAFLENGQFKEAASQAEEAAELAKSLRLPERRALALNREGKALMQGGKKGFLGKDRVAPKFLLSNDILRENGLNNPSLAIDNLENLRVIALKAGKGREVVELDALLNRLRNGGGLAGDAPTSKQDLRNELSTLQQQLDRQDAQRNAGEVVQMELLRQSQELQNQLAAKEAAISQMTDAQMKAELMLMQQNQMLDSMSYRASVDSLSLANWNLALRQAESSRNFNYAIMGVLLLLAGGATFSWVRARQHSKVMEEKNKMIRDEKERSENLLLNILPALVAEELKQHGRTDARYFSDVTVLFADFVGFSQIAEKLSPQQLVSDLDTCFQAFDHIISRYGLEKIKTIGDAYMCAGGMSDGVGNQVHDMTRAALEMQEWLTRWDAERKPKGLPRFEARIGIHSGPLVAGVVGFKKFAFDIWGDTVNIAARIEQAGEGGKINISGEAYRIISDHFPCQYRGKIAVKNKGEIDMYFVEN